MIHSTSVLLALSALVVLSGCTDQKSGSENINFYYAYKVETYHSDGEPQPYPAEIKYFDSEDRLICEIDCQGLSKHGISGMKEQVDESDEQWDCIDYWVTTFEYDSNGFLIRQSTKSGLLSNGSERTTKTIEYIRPDS